MSVQEQRPIPDLLEEMERQYPSAGTLEDGTTVRQFNERIIRHLLAGERLNAAQIRQVYRALLDFDRWIDSLWATGDGGEQTP